MRDKIRDVEVKVKLSPEKLEKIKKICEEEYKTTVEAMLEATIEYHIEHNKKK